MNWEIDGRGWPNHEASRFVEAAGFRWHVQRQGQGPKLLLLHGTGASSHSYADLQPMLAEHFDVLTPDLPGHAFTGTARRSDTSLAGMADAVARLLEVENFDARIVVGHSAGAAVLVRMCLDGRISPLALISLNGALLPFRGVAGRIFSPLAKMLVRAPLVPALVARRASDKSAVARLLEGTGSRIPQRQIDIYARLFANRAHVAATMDMMAQWDLESLERDLPRLAVPLVLVAAGDDEAVKPATAFAVERMVPGARVVYLRGVGHLAHEEQPRVIADLVADEARGVGLFEAREMPNR